MKYEWTHGAATFKRRLILLMAEHGLSQNTVAEFAGVSQGTVSRWLSGSTPELANVTQLATKAGVPLSWLAYGEGHLKIDYKGVDGFIERAKNRIIPQLVEVNKMLSKLTEERFLPAEDQAIISDIWLKLSGQRARLSHCIEALEKLPPEEEGAVLEILNKHWVPAQSDSVRGEICVALGMLGTSTDNEILDACRKMLKNNPHPTTVAKDARAKKVQAAKVKLDALAKSRKRATPSPAK